MTDTRPTAQRQRLEELLAPYGQQHVLAFWEQLSEPEQLALSKQVHALDLKQLDLLYRQGQEEVDWAALARRADPPPAIRLDGESEFSPQQAHARGAAALAAGEVGVVLVAGGQGTRLGFEDPKGMYRIGPVSGATLFQILLEKVAAVERRYAQRPPLYLMTSPVTDAPTRKFLTEHDYFGLSVEDLFIFCQGTMPALDASTGRLLLATRGSLSLSPDGHGGLLTALARNGALADIQSRGLRQLFYFQVDNPLADVCDPEFIGYHLLAGSELSTQVVAKQAPLDRVGNVVSIDGKVQIIEYSDLPPEAAEQRQPDGSLKFWAGNTAVHVLDVDLVSRMSGAGRLPLHRALKKAPYVDEAGRTIKPEWPNALKFEQFIFDLLPAARNALVVEIEAAANFAPVKNAPGAERDSPEHVQAQMIALHAGWLRAAGATLADTTPVEISPLFAVDAAEVAGKLQPGLKIDQATYFR